MLESTSARIAILNFRGDLAAYHGPFNNSLLTSSKTKKSLDKLSSLYDFDLFNTSTRQDEDLNFNNNLLNYRI